MSGLLNVGCGPHRAPAPWWNTDVIAVPGHIEPDQVVDPRHPFPFGDRSMTRVYCGHVLEHIAWEAVPNWLDGLARTMTDDGILCVVGPDTIEALERWRAGVETWAKVAAIIEGPGAYTEAAEGWTWDRWDADRHHWCCHEDRVVEVLERCGWRDVTPIPRLPDGRLDAATIRGDGWPLVDGSPCQFSVTARRPT